MIVPTSHSWALALIAATCCLLATMGLVRGDDRKTASELIRSRGFDVDEFDVLSQNYNLKIYRIINPLANPKTLHKIPVIAAHGINWDIVNMMASSKNSRPRKPKLDERVTLYAMENGTDDRGLYFYLSNNNYDVWLIESRATNGYNQRRLADGSNKKSFWDFSLDEQALIDLPVQTEFILKKTGAPKFAYIAFSQSTTFMFALLSMRPDFSEKLACFVAMAPVVFTSHMRGMSLPISLMRIYFHTSSASENVPEWARKLSNFALTYLCSISFIKYTLCRSLMAQLSGIDNNAYIEGGMTENAIKSTSIKSFEQYVNNAMIKDFRMYDYKDELRNMEEYGQPVPPAYNVSKINLKTIVLFRGTNDYLSNPEDQMMLLSRLRVPLYEDHILEDYAHIDFIVSPTVTRDVNEPILRVLDRITNRSVHRVSHTLGNPNPQVQGTKLVMDVKQDFEQVSSKLRQNATASNADARSKLSAERPKDGVTETVNGGSVHEQLFGSEKAEKLSKETGGVATLLGRR